MNRHQTDSVSLTFGLIFVTAVLWWMFGWAVPIPLPRLGWLVAAGLIVLGLLGLIGALRTDRRRRPQPPDNLD